MVLHTVKTNSKFPILFWLVSDSADFTNLWSFVYRSLKPPFTSKTPDHEIFNFSSFRLYSGIDYREPTCL